MINFQGGPDLILFFPFCGIFGAFFLLEAVRMAESWSSGAGYQRAVRLIPHAVAALMLAVAFQQGLTVWRSGSGFFKKQDSGIKSIGELMGSDDKIYVHGVVEILVLLNKPNLNPYVFVDWGMDDFIAHKWYGGSFQNILNEMESESPKFISLSRLGRVNHGEDLERWVLERYDKSTVGGYDLFQRRPDNSPYQ